MKCSIVNKRISSILITNIIIAAFCSIDTSENRTKKREIHLVTFCMVSIKYIILQLPSLTTYYSVPDVCGEEDEIEEPQSKLVVGIQAIIKLGIISITIGILLNIINKLGMKIHELYTIELFNST